MRFSRDSAIWWLAIAGAVVGYLLSVKTPPTQWDYMQWLNAAFFAVSTIAAKLATSPLAGAKDAQKVDRTKIGSAALLVFALGLVSTGCASANPRHIATVSVVSSHTVLAAAQDLTRSWRCGEPTAPPTCIPPETYGAKYAPLFVEAFDKDQKIAELVRATPGDASIGSLLGSIGAILDKIAALLPADLRARLLAQIGGAS